MYFYQVPKHVFPMSVSVVWGSLASSTEESMLHYHFCIVSLIFPPLSQKYVRVVLESLEQRDLN